MLRRYYRILRRTSNFPSWDLVSIQDWRLERNPNRKDFHWVYYGEPATFRFFSTEQNLLFAALVGENLKEEGYRELPEDWNSQQVHIPPMDRLEVIRFARCLGFEPWGDWKGNGQYYRKGTNENLLLIGDRTINFEACHADFKSNPEGTRDLLLLAAGLF